MKITEPHQLKRSDKTATFVVTVGVATCVEVPSQKKTVGRGLYNKLDQICHACYQQLLGGGEFGTAISTE